MSNQINDDEELRREDEGQGQKNILDQDAQDALKAAPSLLEKSLSFFHQIIGYRKTEGLNIEVTEEDLENFGKPPASRNKPS